MGLCRHLERAGHNNVSGEILYSTYSPDTMTYKTYENYKTQKVILICSIH